MRNLLVVCSVLGLVACQGSAGIPQPPPDERAAELGITCEANVALQGNFQMGLSQPPDYPGCWPVGTWTFAATFVNNSCNPLPQLETQYQFTVSLDADGNQLYQYVNDPTGATQSVMRAQARGGTWCEGQLLYYSADGKTVFNMKPHLYDTDYHLDGQGEILQYLTDQR